MPLSTVAIAAAGRVDVDQTVSDPRLVQYARSDQKSGSTRSRVEADEEDYYVQPPTDSPSATKSVTKTGRTAESQGTVKNSSGRNPNVPETADHPEDSLPDAEFDGPLGPLQMAPEGFPPLLSDIVDIACESSEAHPVAVAANLIAYLCVMLGRGLFQRIGDAVIHCRPFLLIVGKSGKARKGTSEVTVRKIMDRADEIIAKRRGIDERGIGMPAAFPPARALRGSFVIQSNRTKKTKVATPGMDKRLLAIESEFDNVLSQLRRDSNILSATIRNLFDGRDLKPLTKTNPTRATLRHVSIIGHITGHELRVKATANDMPNGLLNRFLVLYVSWPRMVALPRPTPEAKIEELAERVADAVMSVTRGELHADNKFEVTMSEAATELW